MFFQQCEEKKKKKRQDVLLRLSQNDDVHLQWRHLRKYKKNLTFLFQSAESNLISFKRYNNITDKCGTCDLPIFSDGLKE